MEDIIHLLPDSVANQIAAGEVVQRPASIVKEMMENAIDADARRIQVVVVDGGRTSVQVIDNGKGMSETDARLSFERHATSKITQAADLYSLRTMGFRGEALASIAAVAQVELRTRRPDDEVGTLLRISGAKVECQEPVACPVGSNFSVKNLFFNVPARRKFLKSVQTEMANVTTEFERIALVYPQLELQLFHGQSLIYQLASTSLRQRIVDIFGKKADTSLLPVQTETAMVAIAGYVATPESSRRKGAHQYFFVNGRYMRHPYFHSAVMRAYDQLIPVGEHVDYFLYLSVDPSAIDVNVHPTKTEIKFDEEQSIWQVLCAAVKESLGRFINVPAIDFDVDDRPEIPAIGTLSPSPPKPRTVDYNPFQVGVQRSQRPPRDWQALCAGMETFDPANRTQPHAGSLVSPGDMPIVDSLAGSSRPADPTLWDNTGHSQAGGNPFANVATMPHFQYRGRYIVTPMENGLLFVDQHRAHTRVLYEQYIHQADSDHPIPSQRLLFPELVHFTANESATLEDLLPQFEALGFELSSLGGGAYSVVGMPADVGGLNPSQLLHELVFAALERIGNPQADVGKALALALARSASVVYGQALSDEEIARLLTDLFALPTPLRTPDGKLVFFVLEHHIIERNF